MTDKKKIIAIPGSTRQQSSNLSLIIAISEMYADKLDFFTFRGLADIPHFNPDLDGENVPPAVKDFRRKLAEADGILICTPEYAMGVPGTLKNAIDWTVSSMEFSHKPAALITASSSGLKGHQSLIETLKVIEADIPEASRLLIPFVKTKLQGNRITDLSTLELVKKLMGSLIETIDKRQAAPAGFSEK